MNRCMMCLVMMLAVIFTACRPDITNINENDFGDGDGDNVSDVSRVVSVKLVPDSATRSVGDTLRTRVQCLNRFGGQVEPCDVVWSSDSEAITVSGGLITFVIVGTGEVCATIEVDGIRIKGCGHYTTTVAPIVIPPDTTTPVTAKWLRGFTPADTTIFFSTKYNLVGGLAIVPQGQAMNILVQSRGCIASSSSTVTRVGGDTVAVRIEVVGIAICRDSLVVKLSANTQAETFVKATVISAGQNSDTTVTITPRSGSGASGSRLQTSCIVTGPPALVDRRCKWYSTGPDVLLVMPNDTTLTVQSGVWAPGTYPGGLIHRLSPGTRNVCTFLVVAPKFADCGTYTVSGPSGVATLSEWQTQPVRHYDVPDEIRRIMK